MVEKLTSTKPDPFELANGSKVVLKADLATLTILKNISKLKNVKTLSFIDPKGKQISLNEINKQIQNKELHKSKNKDNQSQVSRNKSRSSQAEQKNS
jgi:hypothetical protein